MAFNDGSKTLTRTLSKAVIPAAGLGTRLLPVTKEIPKEMLPIPIKKNSGAVLLKPMLQAVYEQLYDFGIKNFCFIVGRGKRAIEDHFVPDVSVLRRIPDTPWRRDLEGFYEKIESSHIYFVTQPEPKGFGDAVLKTEKFIGQDPFIVHAGDDLVVSENGGHLRRLMQTFGETEADAVLLVERNPNPQRYGVVLGEPVEPKLYRVSDIMEKPRRPRSNLTAVAIYIFKPSIFSALAKTKPDRNNEIQLTNAVRSLVRKEKRVYAVELLPDERRIDIGTHESFLKAYSDLAGK